MLSPFEKILFFLMVIESGGLAYFTFRSAFAVIRSGEGILHLSQVPQRLWQALDVTLTQRTVFRTRFGASVMHSFIVWGFLFFFLTNIGDAIEGFWATDVLGTGLISDLYRLTGDLLCLLIILGMTFFLIRRFILKTPVLAFHDGIRLHPKALAGMNRDSLIVGVFILVHVGTRFLGETFWIALHSGGDSWQPVANMVAGLWSGQGHETLEIGEHFMWWLALGSILVFIPYFPYTKHMHLFMGPLNFFSRPARTSLGALDPLDFEDENREQFGVARIEHLSQTQIFDAFACIMCNRCQDVCPAYVTGKELSPSALEINKRYEIKDHMTLLVPGQGSSQNLLDFAITSSATWACTACGACIDICPVGNEPMFDIIDIRRDLILTQGNFPNELQGAFRGMENAGNPWQIGQSRMAWTEGLEVPTVDEIKDFDVLFWVGCAGSLEPRAQRTSRALAQILNAAGVKFAILGELERCTGDTARRTGNEYLYYEMALANIDLLNTVAPPRIVVTCPHCYHTLAKEYPQFGGNFEVVHHSTFLNELLDSGRLKVEQSCSDRVTFHDPCYLGRHNGLFNAPREILAGIGVQLTEMPHTRKKSFCCGAGGGQFWKEEEHGHARVNITRFHEAKATESDILATGCPFCLRMLDDARLDSTVQGGPIVKDVAEVLAETMGLGF
jgi:Fe-S oxidoreductase